MNNKKLQAVAAALVATIRDHDFIPYSENMEAVYPIDKRGDYFVGRDERRPTDEQYESHRSEGKNREYAQLVLDSGSGLCQELAMCVTSLASLINISELGLDIESEKKLYVSMVSIDNQHVFCFLHTSEHLAHTKVNQRVAHNFNHIQLFEKPEMSRLSNEPWVGLLLDAIIVDPWIYKATPVREYQNHLEQAEKFGVENFYGHNGNGGKIRSCEYTEIVTTTPRLPETKKEVLLLQRFNKAYQEELKKLQDSDPSFAEGRTLKSVQEQLDKDIQSSKVNEQLERLKLELSSVASDAKKDLITECESFQELCIVASIRQKDGILNPFNTTTTGNKMLELINSKDYTELKDSMFNDGDSSNIRMRDIRAKALGANQRPQYGYNFKQDEQRFLSNKRTPEQIFLHIKDPNSGSSEYGAHN
ncbi:hypothetical protein L3V83_02295 [Thiotrichales bacterium 19X7-9]|nr:hypothetical protein [Thiotrichales bacterium 19X7-9]